MQRDKDYAYPVLDDCDSVLLYIKMVLGQEMSTWCQDFHHLVRVERMSQFCIQRILS